jgi:hypothetical protein
LSLDRELRGRLESFLRPLYQDVDGVSRFEEVERIAAIARKLHPSADRDFELLLLFHRLGRWLDKVGNLTRTVLAVGGLTEAELRRTAASIARLEQDPRTDAEHAVAAAVMIDSAGVRGLTELFTRARREGSSLMDVVRAALSDVATPEWLPPLAIEWLHQRREVRRALCKHLLDELDLADLRK